MKFIMGDGCDAYMQMELHFFFLQFICICLKVFIMARSYIRGKFYELRG
jgi:hypothetical protein